MLRDFLKRRALLLPILPVILIEAFVLNRSVTSYLLSQNSPSSTPDTQIALENTQGAVLGASADLFGSVMIEHLLLVAIVVVVVGMIFLWIKTPSQKAH